MLKCERGDAVKKHAVLAGVLLSAAVWLCGCQHGSLGTAPPVPETPPAPQTAAEDALVYFSFSENGSYFERVQGYDFCAEDDSYTVLFRMANEEEPYTVPVDLEWVQTLTGFIDQYDMIGWDGFSGTSPGLLDGTHFGVEFSLADGTGVSAGGYGAFPDGYTEASAAIEEHFMKLLPEEMRDW